MKRSIVLVSLLLAGVLVLSAAPSAARAEGYVSLLWTDRPVCLLLADCTDHWRVRVRYNLEWQPPVAYAPALFTDADVLLRASSSDEGHFKPLHGWFGGGVRWHFNGLSFSLGGTSAHYLDRTSPAVLIEGNTTNMRVYNYLKVCWGDC